MDTMKALVLNEWGGPLGLEERPIPSPAAGEVLVKVEACGVGSTLLNVRAGRMAGSPGASVPRVLGNEVAGELVALGGGVGDLSMGRRGVTYMYLTCERCGACRFGHDPLCEKPGGYVGVAIDGGMAEYMVVPATNFLPLPEGVSAVDGAVAADAVATPWHALRRVAPITPSDILVVVGAGGGVGIHAVIIGRRFGARVVAIDVTEKKLEFAREHGADGIVDGHADDVVAAVLDATGGHGADVVLDYVAAEQTLHDAFSYLAPEGTLVVQGVNPPDTRFRGIEPRAVMHRQLKLTGGRHASRREVLEALDLIAGGRLHTAVTQTVRLDQAEQLFDALGRGALLGRGAIAFDR